MGLPEMRWRVISPGTPPKTYCCAVCGSAEVTRDANASWDDEEQEWVIEAVFDASYCKTCDAETPIAEKPLT